MGSNYQGRQLLLIHKHNLIGHDDNASMYKLQQKHMHNGRFSEDLDIIWTFRDGAFDSLT